MIWFFSDEGKNSSAQSEVPRIGKAICYTMVYPCWNLSRVDPHQSKGKCRKQMQPTAVGVNKNNAALTFHKKFAPLLMEKVSGPVLGKVWLKVFNGRVVWMPAPLYFGEMLFLWISHSRHSGLLHTLRQQLKRGVRRKTPAASWLGNLRKRRATPVAWICN